MHKCTCNYKSHYRRVMKRTRRYWWFVKKIGESIYMIVYLSLTTIKGAILYRSHWSTWHFSHLVQQLHDCMEARDYYPAMSGDKLPMVSNSSRISLSTSSVYLIYICDLPAVVQHCSIGIYADGTSIYISTSTCSVCPAGGRHILGAFMIGSNIMDSR